MLTLTVIAILGAGSTAAGAWLNGGLQSSYYLYQDAGGNDRFTLNESFYATVTPRACNGWAIDFNGELRDANESTTGVDDARLLSLALKGSMGPVKAKLGRIFSTAGGYSTIDGGEVSFNALKIRTTIGGGREIYSLYRTERADLPERYRAAVLLEGVIPKGPTFYIDHASRFLHGEIDDQVTTLGFRCRRFARFGWDLKAGYDIKASALRDFAYRAFYKFSPDFKLSARYTERRMRIYQSSILSNYELAPTRLAGITAKYHLSYRDLWLGLSYDMRFRDEGDLNRISLSVADDGGELGFRYQSGTDLNQFGGWLDAYGMLSPRLGWAVSVAFDRWDSAWDAEPSEEWANSAALNYELIPGSTLSGRIEHYRTTALDSDIRGLIAYKLQFGL
jgi:hypothetical protein